MPTPGQDQTFILVPLRCITGEAEEFLTAAGIPYPSGAISTTGQNQAFILVPDRLINSVIVGEAEAFLATVGIQYLDGVSIRTAGQDQAFILVPDRSPNSNSRYRVELSTFVFLLKKIKVRQLPLNGPTSKRYR
jgi:hypothetical protein